jgi:serine/threonine protein phosphatase PrpC
VREYAYSEEKNYRFRPAMEDTHAIRDKLGNDPNCGLFCVFDGHGGKQVADHCAERIPEEMRKEVMKTPGDLSHTLDSVFLKIDNELRLLDAD